MFLIVPHEKKYTFVLDLLYITAPILASFSHEDKYKETEFQSLESNAPLSSG